MFLQGSDVISHEAKLVASKMIEVVPCVNPSFVQVVENYSDKGSTQVTNQEIRKKKRRTKKEKERKEKTRRSKQHK